MPEQSALEVVMTMLHAGGKFGGSGYKVSGGLHGVGVSVVNALSRRLEVAVCRDGARWAMCFGDGGSVETPLHRVEDLHPGAPTGTAVRFWPDPGVFDEVTFHADRLTERLQVMAFLNAGLRIRFRDLRAPSGSRWVTYRYTGGIEDFVRHVNASKEALFSDVGYFRQVESDQEVEVAFQWNTAYNTDGLHSFANGITTTEGGMHEEGFRRALTGAVNRYADRKGPAAGRRQPAGRGHPRGPDGHCQRAPARAAVRGPDQEQAGQRLHAFTRGARHQRSSRQLARGAPDRGPQDGHEGHRGLPRPRRGPGGPGRQPPQVGPQRRGPARQTHRLHVGGRRRERAVHRGGRLRRRLGQEGA